MDILQIIRSSIDALPEGPYLPGLRSVLNHIEVAYRHLARGQADKDDSAFTDAIYRTNQAFEGSIKEAYRVLAGMEPKNKRPYDIEKYLEKNQRFKPRVLDQLKNYREKWRNPSTHDYNLYFDEAEAFLAIASVSAFAKLLIDQVTEHLSFVASQEAAEQKSDVPSRRRAADFPSEVANLIVDFINSGFSGLAGFDASFANEAHFMGLLAGYISVTAPDINFVLEEPVGPSLRNRVDMVLSRGGARVLFEAIRWREGRVWSEMGVDKMSYYLSISDTKQGIILYYDPTAQHYEKIVRAVHDRTVHVVRPVSENLDENAWPTPS